MPKLFNEVHTRNITLVSPLFSGNQNNGLTAEMHAIESGCTLYSVQGENIVYRQGKNL